MPIRKEGRASDKETVFGRNAQKVASLNKVKIRKKMTSRLVTQIRVLGIRNRDSIVKWPTKKCFFPGFAKVTAERSGRAGINGKKKPRKKRGRCFSRAYIVD
jgi:hypothetical protein